MIFWICLIVAAIATVFAVLACRNYWDGIDLMLFIFTFISWTAVLIMTAFIIVAHVNADGEIAALQERYKIISYQLENDFYDNDNDIGKRELYEQIREWNENLAYRKKIQNNFWIGIFYPNIYENFEFIELQA